MFGNRDNTVMWETHKKNTIYINKYTTDDNVTYYKYKIRYENGIYSNSSFWIRYETPQKAMEAAKAVSY
jgi:hypothetical protein